LRCEECKLGFYSTGFSTGSYQSSLYRFAFFAELDIDQIELPSENLKT
jgi:hypothetical protein